MARCIFHIDLDAFFVSVEQVLNPKLKGKPVIVGGDPERRGLALNASNAKKRCFWRETYLREG
jgi:DNA polymerase-4